MLAVAFLLRIVLFLGVGAWEPARLEERIFVGDAREYLAGFWLGLATLFRPVSLFVCLALAPVVWLCSRGRPGVALARWALLTGVFVLTLLPWMLRNQRVSGSFRLTSMQASIVTWYMPRLTRDPNFAPKEGEPPRPFATSLLLDARGYARGAVRYFAVLGSGELPLILGIPYGRHDAIALREASLSDWIAATLHNRSTPLERSLVVFIAAYLALLYLAAARGVWRAARARRWVESTLLLATIAYFVVATGPIAVEVRYRMPALPAIVLLAGLGLAPRAASPRFPPAAGRSLLAK